MARGGKRPGSGPKPNLTKAIANKRVGDALRSGRARSPLEVLLEIMEMNAKIDPETGKMVDQNMARQAAKDAAPYMHPALKAIEHGFDPNRPLHATVDHKGDLLGSLGRIAARSGTGGVGGEPESGSS